MASVLQLGDGTTTIDLNVANPPGIQFEEIRLPAPARVVDRVSGHPFVPGSRTVASSLGDAEIEILAVIRGTSVDDVQSRYQALVRLLEQANRWEESRTGSPVRVAFRLNGATNTAYRVVTGASAPVPSRAPDWLPSETAANLLHVRLVLTVEPTWHAGALTTLVNAGALTNSPASNTTTYTPATGDMPSPLTVQVAPGDTSSNRLWLAQVAAVTTTDWGDTADATAYGGFRHDRTATGTITDHDVATQITLTDAHRLAIRGIVRVNATSGTVSKLQFRMVAKLSGETYHTGQWADYDGPTGNWWLVDLGAVPPLGTMNTRVLQSSAILQIQLQYRTSDGTSVGFSIDYAQYLSTYAVAKLSGLMTGAGGSFLYEDALEAGSFVFPAPAPQAYGMYSGGQLAKNAVRHGRLVALQPNVAQTLWLAGFTAGAHTLADTLTTTVKHLPQYALGLRGAG